MLNAHRLDRVFVKALERSWDQDAMLPEHQERYKEEAYHPSYGQCLVATLATLAYHQNLEAKIIFGMVYDEGAYAEGGWHAMILTKDGIPIDVTREQFTGTIRFDRAQGEEEKRIAYASLVEDQSLDTRLNVIRNNLQKHGLQIQVADLIIQQACQDLELV